MKDLQWFPPIPPPRPTTSRLAIAALSVVVAILAAGGHRWLAVLVLGGGVLVLALSTSPVWRSRITWATQRFARAFGLVMTFAFLWPFYFVVFGGTRLLLSISQVDLLELRLQPERTSYWQPAPPEQKRARYYERLFTVEPARQESHVLAWAVGILAFVLLVAGGGEVVLRIMGFGHPIVYRLDPQIGYYPAPNQDVHRYGGEIHINRFGMRSRDITAAKPAGTYRILMLGDSTLYGGSYIDQSQLYATRLEQLLNQDPGALPHSPRRVEVLCMGVNSWGPQHELAYVTMFGLFESDLVMVMGPPDDAYRTIRGIAQLPFFVEGRRPRFAWQEFWMHLRWQYGQRFQRQRLPPGPSASVALAQGIAAWVEIASLVQAEGIPVDFEFLPNQEEAREGRPSESAGPILGALLPTLTRMRVPAAYPLALFQHDLGAAKLYRDGVHLDTAGHRIYANYLRNRVYQLVAAK